MPQNEVSSEKLIRKNLQIKVGLECSFLISQVLNPILWSFIGYHMEVI